MLYPRAYFSLAVKSSNVAHAVGTVHGRKLTSLRAEQISGNEVRVDVRDEGPETLHRIHTWFRRDDTALPGIGYPKGTLLLFSPHTGSEYSDGVRA